jgi:hypothetical protein
MYKFRDVTNSSAAAVTIVGSEPEPEPAANITRCKSFSSPHVYVVHFSILAANFANVKDLLHASCVISQT